MRGGGLCSWGAFCYFCISHILFLGDSPSFLFCFASFLQVTSNSAALFYLTNTIWVSWHIWSQYFLEQRKTVSTALSFFRIHGITKSTSNVIHMIQGMYECSYNAVNFRPNLHKIYPIARPLRPGEGCILRVQTVIYTLPQSLQWCMTYHVIWYRVITELDSIKYFCKTRHTHNGKLTEKRYSQPG